jgi:hypothetical protein
MNLSKAIGDLTAKMAVLEANLLSGAHSHPHAPSARHAAAGTSDRFAHLRHFEALMQQDPRAGGRYYLANADTILAELKLAQSEPKKDDGPGDEQKDEKCSDCDGSGRVSCATCNGTGRSSKKPTKDDEEDEAALATFQQWASLVGDYRKTREAAAYYARHTKQILAGRGIATRRGLA